MDEHLEDAANDELEPGGQELSEIDKEELEKSAQLRRAERYYFGTKRLSQIFESIDDPNLDETDLKAKVLNTIQKEFNVDDNEIGVLELKLDETPNDYPSLTTNVSEFLVDHSDVEDYEKLLRQRFNESQDFTPLNETFSFHTNDEVAFLHMAPSRTLTQSERVQQIMSGLTNLAGQLKDNPKLSNIQDIKMISLLVTNYRSAIEQLGFEVKEVEDKKILEAFSLHKGSLLEADMKREIFIKSYAEKPPEQ